MPNLADQFHSALAGRRLDTARYAESVGADTATIFTDLAGALQGRVTKADVGGTPGLVRKTRASESLIAAGNADISKSYQKAADNLATALSDFAQAERQYGKGLLGKAYKSAAKGVDKNLAEELASKTLIQGSPAKAWWASQEKSARLRFASQVRMGIAAGETNDQIAKRVANALGISRREALALVRSGISAVGNAALYHTYLENTHLLKGVQWSAILDSKTTLVCAGRDGGAWDFEGNPLPQSHIRSLFPGPPPAHWCCRSLLIPVPKSLEELAHEEHGDKVEVGPAEAEVRLQELAGTDPANDKAAAPLPVQKIDLGPDGKKIVAKAALATPAAQVAPASLTLAKSNLSYEKVRAAIQGGRKGIIGVREGGRIIVVQGQEKVIGAVLRNEGILGLKIVEMPQKAKLLGPTIPPAALQAPSHGLTPATAAPFPPATRKAADGQIAARLSYGDWLAGKSAAYQDDALGPARAKLFRAGRLPLSAMVDISGNPLLLSDLEKRGRL